MKYFWRCTASDWVL